MKSMGCGIIRRIRTLMAVFVLALGVLAGCGGGGGSSAPEGSVGTPGGKIARPAISLVSGTYHQIQFVSITCETPGVSLRYTVDGTEPNESSTLYSAPLTVDRSLTLKVRGFRNDMTSSDTAESEYTLKPMTPVISLDSGTYPYLEGGRMAIISYSPSIGGAKIIYTIDGSDPAEPSNPSRIEYSGTIAVNASMTLRAVVVREGWSSSDCAMKSYMIEAPYGTVETPLFSVPGGTYNAEKTVSITCTTADAEIQFSINNEDWITYSGDIQIAESQSIKARASKPGFIGSEEAAAGYTLKPGDPGFSIPAGTYNETQTVTLHYDPEIDGAQVYYTTDGSDPGDIGNNGRISYSGAIKVDASMTIRSAVCKTGWVSSSSQAVYTLVPGAPEFSIGSGTYPFEEGGRLLEITYAPALDAAIVYYTTDGSDPSDPDNAARQEYIDGIIVSSSCTIKAAVIKSGWDVSSATAVYSIEPPIGTVGTPYFSIAGGTYNQAKTVEILCDTAGAVIEYTEDGTTWNQYMAPQIVNTSRTIRARASLSGWLSSAEGAASYELKAESPVIAPATGNYDSSDTQTVSISYSPAVSGARIFYTINGSEPTSGSTEYTIPFAVNSSKLVKAVVIKSGWSNSGFGASFLTVTYTLSGIINDFQGNPFPGIAVGFGLEFPAVVSDGSGLWSKSGLSGTVTVKAEKIGSSFLPSSISKSSADSSIVINQSRFYDGGDGVLVDQKTGYQWQKSIKSNFETYSLKDAYCTSLVLGGFDDWKMPTQAELLTLVDDYPGGMTLANWLNALGFQQSSNDGYWTSTVTPPNGSWGNGRRVLCYSSGVGIYWPAYYPSQGQVAWVIPVRVGYTASGRITDLLGNGFPGVTVSFSGSFGSVSTDSNGNWSKSGLTGSVVATPSRTGWAFNPMNTTVTSANNAINFNATGYSLSGRIIDASGNGYSGVTISFSDGTASTATDSNGFWSQLGFTSSVTVTASEGASTFLPSNRLVTAPSTTVDFGQSYTISGRITDEMSNGVGNVTLQFSNGFSSVASDAGGYWTTNVSGTVTVTPGMIGMVFSPVNKQVSGISNAANVDFQTRLRFIDNGDGTITDRHTNLMWIKSPSSTAINWDGAVAQSANCNVGGYANWRLPDTSELTVLFNNKDSSAPYVWLNNHGFVNLGGHWYWTSKIYYPEPSHRGRYDVSLNTGDISVSDCDIPEYAIFVRNIQ